MKGIIVSLFLSTFATAQYKYAFKCTKFIHLKRILHEKRVDKIKVRMRMRLPANLQ